MKKVIAIKNELIEVKREINHIIKYRKEEIKKDFFTGYRSETAIKLDQAWDRYYTLANELKEACLDDSLIYSSIISLIDEEAKKEKAKQETRVFLTVEDLREAKKDIAAIEEKLISINDTRETQETYKEETVVTQVNDICMIHVNSKEDADFWRLVDEATTDKKMDLVSEVWGDLSSLYNNESQAQVKAEEAEEWKDLKGTDYQVSNCGRVRNNNTKKIIETFESNNMMIVKLGDKYLPVAALVFSLFNDTVCKDIEHIDKDITNNHISNLRAI